MNSSTPVLRLDIVGANAEAYAAVPTLRFTISVQCTGESKMIQSVMLTSQIRIAVERRTYAPAEQEKLAELFGTADRWGDTLKSLYWTHATTVIPSFDEKTEFALLVPCTYDLDVVTAKYFAGLSNGEVPLDFLFSGSVFYLDDERQLQTARLNWDAESRYRMPVNVWKEMIDHYFPNSSWLRLERDTIEKLYDFRAAHSLQTWERTLHALLDSASVVSSTSTQRS